MSDKEAGERTRLPGLGISYWKLECHSLQGALQPSCLQHSSATTYTRETMLKAAVCGDKIKPAVLLCRLLGLRCSGGGGRCCVSFLLRLGRHRCCTRVGVAVLVIGGADYYANDSSRGATIDYVVGPLLVARHKEPAADPVISRSSEKIRRGRRPSGSDRASP